MQREVRHVSEYSFNFRLGDEFFFFPVLTDLWVKWNFEGGNGAGEGGSAQLGRGVGQSCRQLVQWISVPELNNGSGGA